MNRKISTAVSRGNQSTFVSYKQTTKTITDLRWGRVDETEPVTITDHETGETSEVYYCVYEICRWYGTITPNDFINKILPIAQREANLNELDEILTALGATDDYKFKVMKEYLLKKVNTYDASSNVNLFYIGEYPTWLDKATRVGLKLRFDAEIASGLTDTVLWQNGISFPLVLTDALLMLNAIELYASACYDNTQKHLAAINELTTIDELLAYDFTTGYPDKLSF